MKKSIRWQDGLVMLIGLYTALSTIWTSQTGGSLVLMIGCGVLLIAAGAWEMSRPGVIAAEWVQLILGALLFISPWIASYTGHTGAAWTSWILGAVVVIVAALSLQPAMRDRPARAHDHGGATA